MELCIVIPTHNRSQMLLRTLGALVRQTVAPDVYQVIVVADGCRDDTAAVVRGLHVPYSLTLIEQPAEGAAAARNRGVAAARAPLILFLDDDMEAAPGLVAAHLAAHAAHPGGVVLGYFPVPADAHGTDVFETYSNLWWKEHFAAQARPGYRFTFWDFCTGNVSLPRAVLEAAGGFDAGFRGAGGEDYDLGVRLMRQRVRFHYVPEAASIHHDKPTQERSFQRAMRNGRSQALMVSKCPELFSVFQLGQPVAGPILRLLYGLLWRCPPLAASLSRAIRLPLAIARALKACGLWVRMYGCVHGYFYWCGVRAELGTLATLQRLAQDAPLEPTPCHEIEMDIATDLPRLDAILDEAQVDAVRLRYRSMPVGRIAPSIGAEPLRPIHVREALIYQFGSTLSGVLALKQLIQFQTSNMQVMRPEHVREP